MSDKLLDVEIVSPEKYIYRGKAQAVFVPGSLAPFEILYDHAPIFSLLDPGIIKIVDDTGNSLLYAIRSGFVEVMNNSISIVAERIASKEEINSTEINKILEQLSSLKNQSNFEKQENIQKDILYEQSKLKVLNS
ncbi:MAG TPA: ATP synthase F1 subunit epsilon [Bacteroidota bacterium]|nr:ATP synthase F1 subunit epsilon [Candidatus Kapabacteria bacterium]HRS01357.1 ATP synthase F1 subunit epsilon [Bacteroidota bacterium]HRT67575.1 ATP synthase F1 subunit epsilon [Bacteroidota bacterium]